MRNICCSKLRLTAFSNLNELIAGWMPPREFSLSHFQDTCAQAPATGELWRVRGLRGGRDASLEFNGVTPLLNQRDIWRATVTRQAAPALKRPSSPLRSVAL